MNVDYCVNQSKKNNSKLETVFSRCRVVIKNNECLFDKGSDEFATCVGFVKI
jgi:hypothetical protein